MSAYCCNHELRCWGTVGQKCHENAHGYDMLSPRGKLAHANNMGITNAKQQQPCCLQGVQTCCGFPWPFHENITTPRKVQKQTKSSAGPRGPAGPGGSSYHDNNHNNINNSSSSSSSGSISFNLYFVLLRSTYFVLYNSRCSRNTTACYNSTTLRAILQNTTTYYCNVSTNQSILQITILRTTTVRLGTTRAVILRTTTLWLCTAITCYMLRATRTQNVQYNARSNLWDAKNTVTTTFMLQ